MTTRTMYAPLHCRHASRPDATLTGRLLSRLRCWQQRARTRRQLVQLDDRLLQDIGVRQADARQEYRKPFWKP